MYRLVQIDSCGGKLVFVELEPALSAVKLKPAVLPFFGTVLVLSGNTTRIKSDYLIRQVIRSTF
jgi:hypothetical protein